MTRLFQIILAFLIASLWTVPGAHAQNVQYYFSKAKEALQAKEYPAYDSLIQKAYALFPQHPYILWNAGKAAALNGRPDSAIHYLRKAININTEFNLSEADLHPIWKHPEFKRLEEEKALLEKTIIQSDTAFVVDDRQIHLESVAYDPVDKALYGGSIHKRKIIRIDRAGRVTDFTNPAQYGLGAVFGLKVDPKRRLLWACSSPTREMQGYDSTLAAALHQFDLKTGKLLKVYHPGDTLANHVFGDVVLDSQGNPYVSDSRNNIIYKPDQFTGKLVPFFTSPLFWNLQGMAFSPDDRKLYVSDYIRGIFVLDLRTLQLTHMKTRYHLSLKGCDGIYVYGNSLITIQNGVYPHRVVQHFIDKSGTAFSSYAFIDNNHPAFGEPTIGTLHKKTFYYVANSQWNGYDNGSIKPAMALKPVVILRYQF